MALLYDTLDSGTDTNLVGVLRDQYYASTAFYDIMRKRGSIRRVQGGTHWEGGVSYAEQGTGGTYSGAQVLRSEDKEFVTRWQVDRAKYYKTILFTEEDEQKNRGSSQVINLIAEKEKNAMKAIVQNMSYGIFDDGTKVYAAGETNGFVGLQKLVSVGVTTACGIAETDMSDWANIRNDASGELSIALMLDMLMDCSDGTDRPDLILTTKGMWEKYYLLLEPSQRAPMGPSVGKWGFDSLGFSPNIPVVWDNDCPSGYMYFLNMEHLFLIVEEGYDLVRSAYKQPHNQKVRVADITFTGQLAVDKRKVHGVLYGLTEPA